LRTACGEQASGRIEIEVRDEQAFLAVRLKAEQRSIRPHYR
jgi:hypothetical protein